MRKLGRRELLRLGGGGAISLLSGVLLPAFAEASAGNEYPRGQCTWAAKEFRPDIPNHWGHAGGWAQRAVASHFGVSAYPAERFVMVFPPAVMGADAAAGHVAFVQYVDWPMAFITILEANARFRDDRYAMSIEGVPILRRVIRLRNVDARVRFIRPRV